MMSEQSSLGIERDAELHKLQQLRLCENEAQVKAIVERMSCLLGFDFYFYRASFILDRSRSIDRIISNYPAQWLQQYQGANLARFDPAVLHAHSKLTPLVWEPHLYVGGEQQQFADDAQRYGLAAGVSFPVHNKYGDIGVFSLALGASGPNAERLIQKNLFYGPFIANCIHDGMRPLVRAKEFSLNAPLTARELECLNWIACGKSTWETAKILNLSEHGVLHHVRNIMRKFDVTSRHQAVSKAAFCGLI